MFPLLATEHVVLQDVVSVLSDGVAGRFGAFGSVGFLFAYVFLPVPPHVSPDQPLTFGAGDQVGDFFRSHQGFVEAPLGAFEFRDDVLIGAVEGQGFAVLEGVHRQAVFLFGHDVFS